MVGCQLPATDARELWAPPRHSDQYAFEVKWDGLRGLVHAGLGSVTIISRNGNDMTFRYPELRGLGVAVSEPVLFDGEIVMLDEKGRRDFAGLWFRNRKGSGSSGARLCFMAFDVLVGDDVLIDRPYRK